MTLTQTAIIVKQAIVILAVALVLGISSFIGYKIWYAYYLAHLPPVEVKPDIKFGLLPQMDFPKTNVSASNFSYSVDTTTGNLPKIGVDSGFDKFVKVYFVTQTLTSLLSAEKSQALAEKFGILSPPEIISEREYRFKDKNKTLLIDLDNRNFSYTLDATISATINLEDDNKLTTDFKSFLANIGSLTDDLSSGVVKVIPLRTENGKLIPVQNRPDAQAAQISIWPVQIDKRLMFTANFDKALVNATVVGSANNLENYVSLNFIHYPVDTTTFATYPIKTPEVAFDDLKKGKGVVVVEPINPKVSITSVSIGYYLPENYNPYLQPVFVFEGPSFVAYVSAIDEQFITPAK